MKPFKLEKQTLENLVSRFEISEKRLKKFYNRFSKYFSPDESTFLLSMAAEYTPKNYTDINLKEAAIDALEQPGFSFDNPLASNYILTLIDFKKSPKNYKKKIGFLNDFPISFDEFQRLY